MTMPVHGTGPNAGPGLSISEASRRLGVPVPTLRSWELRYGTPVTARTPGGTRRYATADLEVLGLMRDEIARGLSACAAAAAARDLINGEGPAARLVQALLQAGDRADCARMTAQLDAAADQLGLDDAIDDVVLPLMRQIGRWWEAGRCDVEQEHLTTNTVLAWLQARGRTTSSSGTSPSVLLIPSDRHTLGLIAAELLIHVRGVSTVRLPLRLATEPGVAAAINTYSPRAAIVASHMQSGRRQATSLMDSARRSGVPIYYAGNSFLSPRSRRTIRGHYLGTRLQDAAATIVENVRADAARPEPKAQQPQRRS